MWGVAHQCASRTVWAGLAIGLLVTACGGKGGGGGGGLVNAGGAVPAPTSCPAVPFQDGRVTFVPAIGVTTVNAPDGDQVLAANNQLVLAVNGDIGRDELLALQNTLLGVFQCSVAGYASGSHILQLNCGPGRDLGALAQRIAQLGPVRYALPNELVEVVFAAAPFAVPGGAATDPFLLTVVPTPAGFPGDYWIPLTNADSAWAMATGNPTVPIGLTGPGLNPGPVLAPGRLQAYYASGQAGSAVADHGTFAAGLAAGDGARLDNAVGMAWDTRVIYVTNKQPGSALQLLTDAIGAVETAIAHGARAVNMPATFTPGRNTIGTPDNFTRGLRRFRLAMTPVVRYAAERDVLLCFAAGNGGEGASQTHLPAVDLNTDGDVADLAVDAGVATAASATLLSDSTQTWTPNEHAGRLCRIVDGPAGGYVRPIVANTASTLTVNPAWPVPPGAGAAYAIDIDAAVTTTATGTPNFVPEAAYNDDTLLPAGASLDPRPWSTSALIVGATAAEVHDPIEQPFAWTLFPPAGGGVIPIINPDPHGKLAGFSHFGAVLDLVAPGLGLSFGTDAYSGTGLASALVTGATGLVRGAHPDLTAGEARRILLDTANAAPLDGIGVGVGAGLLNAPEALARADAVAAVPPRALRAVTLEEGDEVELPITFTLPGEPRGPTDVLDIVFLVDNSSSFSDDLPTWRADAQDILNAIAERVPDTRFGVASFSDFPIVPYGQSGDEAFALQQPLTADEAAVRTAINAIPLQEGGDSQESDLTGLFQLATGEGLDLTGDADFDDPGEIAPTTVGWRPDALHVVILATDAGMHDSDVEPAYLGNGFTETLAALNAEGIVVIGLSGSFAADADLARVADATDGVVTDLAAGSENVVQAIEEALDLVLGNVEYVVEILNDGEGFAVGLPIADRGDSGESVTVPLTLVGVRAASITPRVYRLMVWVRTVGGDVFARVPIRVTVPAEPCP